MPSCSPIRPAAPPLPWPDRRATCRRSAGFSLVELAIVVLIVSILLTMGLAAFSVQVDTAALSATQRRQETIKDALIAYLRSNKRLPCPETTALSGSPPTGTETRLTPGNPATLCDSFWGTVPFATLGLSRETALDGYGNFFSYFISNSTAITDPDWTLTSTTGVPGFNVGNPGRFSITENAIPTTHSANLAAVMIVSHGKNGSGAFTLKGTRITQPTGADELAYTLDITAKTPLPWTPPADDTSGCGGSCPSPGIRIFPIKAWTNDSAAPGGIFDDIVLALRPNDLLGPIIKDGSMKSAEALVQEQLVNARDAAIAEMLANNCTPKPSLATSLPSDPWGSTILYAQASSTPMTQANQVSLASTNAFRIWSSGPNRVNDSGAGDDKALQTGYITYGQFLSRISPTACPSS